MFLVFVFEEKVKLKIKIVIYKPHLARGKMLIILHIFFRILSN